MSKQIVNENLPKDKKKNDLFESSNLKNSKSGVAFIFGLIIGLVKGEEGRSALRGLEAFLLSLIGVFLAAFLFFLPYTYVFIFL